MVGARESGISLLHLLFGISCSNSQGMRADACWMHAMQGGRDGYWRAQGAYRVVGDSPRGGQRSLVQGPCR